MLVDGVAGHASMPGMGENALLKMGPLLERLAARQPSYELTEEPSAFLQGIGESPGDPADSIERLRAAEPMLATMFEPMLGVTFTPTRIAASEKINVIPSRAELKVDCRVPPGLGEEAVRRGITEVLVVVPGGLGGFAWRSLRSATERASQEQAVEWRRSWKTFKPEWPGSASRRASPARCLTTIGTPSILNTGMDCTGIG